MSAPASPLPQAHLRPERELQVEGATAGFVSRLIAIAIDVAIVVLLIVSTSSLTQIFALLLPKWVRFTAVLPALIAATVSLIPLSYFFLTVAVTGKTVGKGLMGLRIVRAHGSGGLSPARSLVRALAYVVSLVPLGLGFVWVLFDRDRRGWHDMLAGSKVVYEPRSTQL